MSSWLSFLSPSNKGSAYLPDIYPLNFPSNKFVETDVENIYQKILTDVVERTDGLTPAVEGALWDSCLESEAGKGLVSLLAKAMTDKSDLFLVFKEQVLRKADRDEETKIKADYKKSNKSSLGVFISFKNYMRTDMVKLYSGLEYCVINGLNKNVNISTSIQYKIDSLRASVALTDKAKAEGQAQEIADALKNGHDVMLDAKDMIELAKPEMKPIQEAMVFLDSKRCFYLGMPLSYVNGELTGGLGSTGEADTKGIERGLKSYYFSIIRPAIEAIFGVKTTFKSQDFRMIKEAMELLKTFELTSDQFLSVENKTLLVNSMFGLPSDEEGTGEPPPPEPVVVPGVPPPKAKANGR